MFALICKVCHFFSFILLNISAVARVIGELRVGAAVGGRVPYVQVHVRAKRVEAGVLDGRIPPLWLPAEGGVRMADGRDRGGPLGLVLGVVGLALWGPDGSKETGHGGEAAGPREVWLWRTESISSLDTLSLHTTGCIGALSTKRFGCLLPAESHQASFQIFFVFLVFFSFSLIDC